MTGGAERLAARRARGGRARAEGRRAEVWAAFWLMLRGYRVVGFRMRLQGVEADLVVRRGSVLALVEVKRRRTLDEALAAVTPTQRARLRRAGQALAARRSGADAAPAVRLDLLALAPGRPPHHVADAWAGEDGERTGWR
jgi:putative endonuclease